ncbi:MAG: response regulator [Candidatus Omnitrophica bacterium]|nr:response regulator [Candidatus Omnitrophota bacterium]
MARILVVDDEADVREFTKSFFAKRKVEVQVASNGREALEKTKADKFDLVLLDVRMEDMTGTDVLKNLREQGNDVRVIMVTAVEDEEVINEANSWGIVGYIHKPLVLDEMERIVMGELDVRHI